MFVPYELNRLLSEMSAPQKEVFLLNFHYINVNAPKFEAFTRLKDWTMTESGRKIKSVGLISAHFSETIDQSPSDLIKEWVDVMHQNLNEAWIPSFPKRFDLAKNALREAFWYAQRAMTHTVADVAAMHHLRMMFFRQIGEVYSILGQSSHCIEALKEAEVHFNLWTDYVREFEFANETA